MAIDTAAKRHSALGYSGGPPQPDGTIDQADRQTTLAVYGGILAASVTEISARIRCSVSRAATPVVAVRLVSTVLAEVKG